jgi:methionyl aminopeptidase
MITIKTKQELEIMRQGGKILASVLSHIAKEAKEGVTTKYLDELAEELIFENGALPAFKGFDGYPASLCTSINEEIVHALPSNRKLKNGDILGLDLGLIWPPESCGACPMNHGCQSQRGMFTDMAVTVTIGKVSPEAAKIVKVSRGALEAAISKVKPGRKLSEVSKAISDCAQKNGFVVIRELVGHGIGYDLHEDPQIFNYYPNDFKDVELKEGMVLAIEPMLSAGSWRIKKGKDGYSYVTQDSSLSAHFEHTVAVTKNGCEILTTKI